MSIKKVLVLGAGYGGVHAAQVLDRLSKGIDSLEITLVNKTPYHVLLTELHEVAGNRIHPDAVRIPLKKIFKKSKVKIVEDTITDVDFNTKKLSSELNTALREGL
jgi:NADH dehydrogenase